MDLLRDLEELDGDSNSEEEEELTIQEDATLALLESVKNADQITHIAKLSSSKHYSEVLNVMLLSHVLESRTSGWNCKGYSLRSRGRRPRVLAHCRSQQSGF